MIKKQLSDRDRIEIVLLRKTGKKVCTLARQFKVHRTTVVRIVQRYDKEGNSDRKPRRNYAQKVNLSMEQMIVRTALANPEEPMHKIRDLSCLPLCRMTVANVLKKNGIEMRTKAKKPLISPSNQIKRLNFALEHLNKTHFEWAKIVFSDESKIVVPRSKHVLRRKGERMLLKHITPTKQYEESEMVWGCFHRRKLGPLVFCNDFKKRGQRGMNGADHADMLGEVAIPYFESIGGRRGITFQQDNAPIHKVKKVKVQFSNFSGFGFFSILVRRSLTSSMRTASKLWIGLHNRLT